VKNVAGTANLAQENQAIKKQKLDGGRSRQVIGYYCHVLLIEPQSSDETFT
jgi:hypothetical protein